MHQCPGKVPGDHLDSTDKEWNTRLKSTPLTVQYRMNKRMINMKPRTLVNSPGSARGNFQDAQSTNAEARLKGIVLMVKFIIKNQRSIVSKAT